MNLARKKLETAQVKKPPVKIVSEKEDLMPSHFKRHEHRIRACFIEELRKAMGAIVHKATTWKEIKKLTESFFTEAVKDNHDNVKKEIAALLGFSSFETMMKCIELGKNFEEGRNLKP